MQKEYQERLTEDGGRIHSSLKSEQINENENGRSTVSTSAQHVMKINVGVNFHDRPNLVHMEIR
jgi:hypothetical protein